MLRASHALGLGDVLGAMPGELSTGQRKLVALARAIASEPSVLLLDEPCSGLDHHEREEVGGVIRTLAQSWGIGVLLVEHDIHLVRRVSDRIVALDFGKVIAEGPRECRAVRSERHGGLPGGSGRERGRDRDGAEVSAVLETRDVHAGYGKSDRGSRPQSSRCRPARSSRSWGAMARARPPRC